MLQKPQLREKAILVLKKNTTQTKQNKTLAQRESGNRYETKKKNPKQNMKNANLYKNGRKANLIVVRVRR